MGWGSDICIKISQFFRPWSCSGNGDNGDFNNGSGGDCGWWNFDDAQCPSNSPNWIFIILMFTPNISKPPFGPRKAFVNELQIKSKEKNRNKFDCQSFIPEHTWLLHDHLHETQPLSKFKHLFNIQSFCHQSCFFWMDKVRFEYFEPLKKQSLEWAGWSDDETALQLRLSIIINSPCIFARPPWNKSQFYRMEKKQKKVRAFFCISLPNGPHQKPGIPKNSATWVVWGLRGLPQNRLARKFWCWDLPTFLRVNFQSPKIFWKNDLYTKFNIAQMIYMTGFFLKPQNTFSQWYFIWFADFG